MGGDPFPLPVKGNNLEELLERHLNLRVKMILKTIFGIMLKRMDTKNIVGCLLKEKKYCQVFISARSDDIIEIYCNNDDWAARGILFD